MVNSVSGRLQLVCNSLEELDEVAAQIIAFADDCKVWLFEGQMGAGKTTLIKAIGRQFNIEDNVNSPTFSIVNEYQNDQGEIFYHFDFYRLRDEHEAMDIGAEEYFYSGNRCFLEWPSKVEGLIPDGVLKIDISIEDSEKRLIELAKYE